jgi:protein O-GlcNAc transferase
MFPVLHAVSLVVLAAAFPTPQPPIEGFQAKKNGPSQAQMVQAATEAFRAGSEDFGKGDLAGARREFERAVKLAPQAWAAHGALGSVLLAQGEAAGAVRELSAARRLHAGDRAVMLNLAVAESLTGDFRGSAQLYNELRAGGDAPEGSLTADAAIPLGAALSETGDKAGAASLLGNAVAAAPNDARLQDARGTVQAGNGEFAAAEQTLRKAVGLEDSLASAHFHLGSVMLETHRPQEAVAELDRAHVLAPALTGYTLQLARALMEGGEEAKAVELLRGALQAGRTNDPEMVEVRYRLALALQATEQVKEALPLFSEVVKARPADAEVLTNAGLDHVQLGDATGGIELYLRAMKVNPADVTLRQNLGVAYLQQSDITHALEQFREGLKLDPENPQLHYDLGLALKLKDDLPGAIPEFERAAALDPSLPDPPYTLGIIYMQQGRFAEAAKSLEQVTVLRPENGDAWATLGSVYKQSEQPEKAVVALRKAIALLPEQPSPHITLAAILAAQGKKDEAAAERKVGADLTRVAVNRQKAAFALDSGTLLVKRGQFAEALVQFQDAVSADPGNAAAHLALAEALDHAGRRGEATDERRKAKDLAPAAR